MTSGGIGVGGGGLILADWLYVASASAQVQVRQVRKRRSGKPRSGTSST